MNIFFLKSVFFVVERERKLSKGETGSDSSSKDGSIQSDTSIDSEDSCVSVIFVPHPETSKSLNKPEEVDAAKKQRSTSNSSESSDSVHSGSGRGSPMSPSNSRGQAGSPVKAGAVALCTKKR